MQNSELLQFSGSVQLPMPEHTSRLQKCMQTRSPSGETLATSPGLHGYRPAFAQKVPPPSAFVPTAAKQDVPSGQPSCVSGLQVSSRKHSDSSPSSLQVCAPSSP